MRTTVVAVPLALGETVRSALATQGRLAKGFRIGQGDGVLLVPVTAEVGELIVVGGESFPVSIADLETRSDPTPAWQDLVELPAEVEFPSSFDLIGATAIIKFPPTARPHARELAEALVLSNPRITTVLMDHGIKGEYRIRDLETLVGEVRVELVKEHGLELEVDPTQVFFTPRLAVERKRVADLILESRGPGTRVIDMFAGVGPFSCVIARHAAPAHVDACELNPQAVSALRLNIERNRLTEVITAHAGDTRTILPGLASADVYLLNLPFGAAGFLTAVADHASSGAQVIAYQQRTHGEPWQGPIPERWTHQGAFGVKEYAPREWVMRDWWVVG